MLSNSLSKEEIFRLVECNQLSQAKEYLLNRIAQYQTDEELVHLFILFRISNAEREAQEPDIFSCTSPLTIDNLLKHFTLIKFYLRRFEYDLPAGAKQEAMDYFLEYPVSANAIYHIATYACIDTDREAVFHSLAKEYAARGHQNLASVFRNLD